VQIFRDVGFARVESEDRTDQFVKMLTDELHFVETNVHKLLSVSDAFANVVSAHSNNNNK